MGSITVVKSYHFDPDKYDVIQLIDRSTPLGNPFTSKDLKRTKAVFRSANRENSISEFEKWLVSKLETDNDTSRLFNSLRESYISNKIIALVCHCKPKPCHGDVIKRLITSPTLW
jgi:hypothetical protein